MNGAGGIILFDTTFLSHAKDLRGVPQVILQLTRLFLSEKRFAKVAFITTEAVFGKYLEPLGMGRDRIRLVGRTPLIGGMERFHGLFSTWRYRKLVKDAALLIHPELRTVIRGKLPQVVLYHDFIIFEDAAARGKRKWTRYLYYYYKNLQAAKAPYRVCNSEHTRRRAAELFPGRGGDLRALHLGARAGVGAHPGEKVFPAERAQFLYVGSFEARKNIDAMLANLPSILGTLPYDLHLVGHAEGGRRLDLERKAAGAPGSGRVHLHGLVTDGQLEALYRRAHFLLFPTLFEGFGLPMVEAMGHGVVVCAFNNSCIPEVGGDAVILCENDDFAGWGRRISEMAADPGRYAEASRRARARAAHFSEAGMMERYRDYFTGVFASLGAA